jgi:hypothetical protein
LWGVRQSATTVARVEIPDRWGRLDLEMMLIQVLDVREGRLGGTTLRVLAIAGGGFGRHGGHNFCLEVAFPTGVADARGYVLDDSEQVLPPAVIDNDSLLDDSPAAEVALVVTLSHDFPRRRRPASHSSGRWLG